MFKEKKWSNRIQLILLFVIFLAPLVGAYYAYMTRDSREYDTVNIGEFYPKPQDLADIQFTLANPFGEKSERTFNNLDSKWYLFVVADQDCGQICEKNIEKIAYVNVVHARYTGRIVSALVHNGIDENRSEQLVNKYGVSTLSTTNQTEFAEWLTPFYQARGENAFDAGRIYMVDPLKKLMMSYPADASPLDIYEDMKLLLKTSRVG